MQVFVVPCVTGVDAMLRDVMLQKRPHFECVKIAKEMVVREP